MSCHIEPAIIYIHTYIYIKHIYIYISNAASTYSIHNVARLYLIPSTHTQTHTHSCRSFVYLIAIVYIFTNRDRQTHTHICIMHNQHTMRILNMHKYMTSMMIMIATIMKIMIYQSERCEGIAKVNVAHTHIWLMGIPIKELNVWELKNKKKTKEKEKDRKGERRLENNGYLYL